jgi:D-glycero-D-manno-heptose 1,7-bisphosphate phosphatase
MERATVRQCAVLLGGLGTRLGGLTATTPTPILPCGGRPFLAWVMREFIRFGVEEFLLLTGPLSARVRQSIADIATSLPRPVAIEVSEEGVRAGTGGALFHARGRLDERFLLCNGDTLFDCNLADLLAAAAADPSEVIGRLMLHHLPDACRYGVVELAGDAVVAFRERQASGPAGGIINAGIYLFDRRLLDQVAPACSLERDVLPALAERGALRGTVAPGVFIDIGVPADLARARCELPNRLRRPAEYR